MSAMKHFADELKELLNEENKELLQAVNDLKEHNKLLLEENRELKKKIFKLLSR